MATTVTQKIAGFFHLGRLRAGGRSKLESDGEIRYLAEGIAQTVILRHFKAPGIRCNYRWMGFIGYFVITERRLLASARFHNCVDINTTFDEPRFKQLQFKATPTYVSVSYDSSIQAPDMAGQVEIRFHVPDVAEAAKILGEKGASVTLDGVVL